MKAILVIDVPNDFETKTAIAIVDVKNERGEGVTAMCPLKSLPNKKPVSYHDDLYEDIEKNFRNIGWNDCIEEILNGR